MFTGLIQSMGTVVSVRSGSGGARLIVSAPQLAGQWKEGDSIAVNGVCLTALPPTEPDEPNRTSFAADLADETLRRTTLADLQRGALVNLELPTPAGSPLGGHVVQGHVDGTGILLAMTPLRENVDTTDWRMTIELPAELDRYVIPQGSVTVNGISLTIARVAPASEESATRIEIAVIPHTYKNTNLRELSPGARVNIETDVLSKYARGVQAVAGAPDEWLSPDYLLANGY